MIKALALLADFPLLILLHVQIPANFPGLAGSKEAESKSSAATYTDYSSFSLYITILDFL